MNLSMFIPGGRWRGVYAAGTTYTKNDIVRYQGHAFILTIDSLQGGTPGVHAGWQKMIDRPEYSGLTATQAESVSATTYGVNAGTRKYWFGQEWVLEKTAARSIRLKKVYRNCNCNCNCVCACDCQANQPNCGNCSYNNGNGQACNCACLYQTNCNYNSGQCNCTAQCADGELLLLMIKIHSINPEGAITGRLWDNVKCNFHTLEGEKIDVQIDFPEEEREAMRKQNESHYNTCC